MPRLGPEPRRDAILQAATALFLEHGYAATSLAMILERSGGSRREVYRHFGDKAALFRAAITALFGQAPVAFGSLDTSASPETVLNGIGVMLLSGLVGAGAVTGSHRRLFSDAILFPDIGKLVFDSGPQQMQEPLADYLRDMTMQGRLRVTDATAAAGIFLQMVTGQYQQKKLADPDFVLSAAQIAQHVGQAVTIFLFGISTHPAV